MKVAFYLDSNDPIYVECCRAAIHAVRHHMPEAEVVHLNGGHHQINVGADTVIHQPIDKPFCYRRAALQAQLEGDVLILGVDVIVQDDLSPVFKQDFDIAVTTDMLPGNPSIKYNGDVTFSRCPAFWRDVQDKIGHMDFLARDGDWEVIEQACTENIDSCGYRIKVLDGRIYNYVPQSKHEDLTGRKAVHYRGRRKAWMVDVLVPLEFIPGLNTPADTMMANIRQNLNRGLPELAQLPAHDGVAILVGGGGSLHNTLPNLRLQYNNGGRVFAMNGSHHWLMEQGITPHYYTMLDAREDNKDFVRFPSHKTDYLIAAQCHPSVFDALKDYSVTVWLGWIPEVSKAIDRDMLTVAGGGTVGLRSLVLAYLMGYRRMHLYGYDSCHNTESHAYPQPMNAEQALIEVVCHGRKFVCSRSMAKQAQDFQPLFNELSKLGVSLTVHGDGLITHVLQTAELSA